jgi:mannose-1-phosphate guanylyltransferase/mannose-6-phosphate isomerase
MVRLLTLAPSQELSIRTNSHGAWIPITNDLSTSSGKAIKAGTCLQWHSTKGNQPYRNGNTADINIIELLWTEAAQNQQKALGEVTENRPWGSFTVLADEPEFKLKQLYVKPGNRLSLQRHQKREEHWFVTAGDPTITLNEDTLTPTVGDYIYIPLQAWHRLANATTGNEGVEIIELQLGSYFGEDDIERQSDDYGRQ